MEPLEYDICVAEGDGHDSLVCEGNATYHPVRRFDEHPLWHKARAFP